MLLTRSALSWPMLPSDDPPAGKDADLWALARPAAIDWLWRASGQAYGTRDYTYRPQRLVRDLDSWLVAAPYLVSIYGPLFMAGWPWLDDSGCGASAVLELPTPASGDVVVSIVGDEPDVDPILSPSAYRLDGRWLVRTDGLTWPGAQNLAAEDGEPDTWSVAYTGGLPVPAAGQVAAYQLTLAWYSMLDPTDTNCRLPYNATTVTRSGVTINRDITKALKTTGVDSVDRWVASVNPRGLARPPQVWSPDVPSRRAGRHAYGLR